MKFSANLFLRLSFLQRQRVNSDLPIFEIGIILPHIVTELCYFVIKINFMLLKFMPSNCIIFRLFYEQLEFKYDQLICKSEDQ